MSAHPPQPESELLPCPCCGGTAHLTKGYAVENVWEHGDFHRVFCGVCQLRQLFHRTPADAIAAWNRRASVKAQPVAWMRPGATEPISDALKQADPEFYERHTAPLYAAPQAEREALDAYSVPAAGQRQRFEVWADDQGFPLRRLETSADYLDLRTQGAWDAWQACAARAPAGKEKP